jgi:hypothetical protein
MLVNVPSNLREIAATISELGNALLFLPLAVCPTVIPDQRHK